MPYAFDELKDLARKLPSELDIANPVYWYCSALVAQLAYYHVEKFEIDERKRAKLVPSEGYRAILREGTPPDVRAYLRSLGLDEGEGPGQAFVASTRGVSAIGFAVADKLFVGMRGTIFFSAFDWVRNLSVWKTDQLEHRYHGGFFSEAAWICGKLEQYVEPAIKSGRTICFCGHSLGGAVAAISSEIFRSKHSAGRNIFGCVFGTPRYREESPVLGCGRPYCSICNRLVHIRRRGDKVPDVVPRLLGYSNIPTQFDASGRPTDGVGDHWYSGFTDSAKFALKLFKAHKMETYRTEMGRLSGAKYWGEAFIKGFGMLGGRDVLVTSREWREFEGGH